MRRKLYYVIDIQLENVGHFFEATGWKTITAYEMVDNAPRQFCAIEAELTSSTEDELQFWLDDNGYEDVEFEFINL